MTSEVRTLVELKDVLGVEFECPKCHAKMLYSLVKEHERLAEKCPNCFEPWFTPPPLGPQANPPVAEQVSGWMHGMRNISNRTDVLAKVRLHVTTREFLPAVHVSGGKG